MGVYKNKRKWWRGQPITEQDLGWLNLKGTNVGMGGIYIGFQLGRRVWSLGVGGWPWAFQCRENEEFFIL